jgi:ABC-type glycerol-3-phosphate transport system substrate-binding protein
MALERLSRRRFLGIVGSMAGATLVAACGGTATPTTAPVASSGAAASTAPSQAAGQKVTVRVSSGGVPELPPEHGYNVHWIKPFTDANPDITIKYEGYGNEGETKFLTGLLQGNAPHVWITTRWGTLGRGVELGAVEDLGARFGAWPDKDTIKKEALQVGQIQGKQWAVPWGDVCDSFVTRKSWFEEAASKVGFDPQKAYNDTWTWEDDFDKMMKAMSVENSRWGLASMGSATANVSRWWFQCMVQSYGADIVKDDGGKLVPTFVSPSSIEVAKLYQRGIAEKFIPRDSATWGFDEASNAWFSGTVGTIIAGRWVKANAIKNLKDDFIALSIPKSKNAPNGGKSWYAGNTHIGFLTNQSKSAAEQDAAWKVLSAMMSKETQTGLAKAGEVPFPVRTDINVEQLYADEPYWAGMISALKTKTPPATFPSHEKLEDVYTELAKAVGYLLSDPNADPQKALEEAQQKAELLLK